MKGVLELAGSARKEHPAFVETLQEAVATAKRTLRPPRHRPALDRARAVAVTLAVRRRMPCGTFTVEALAERSGVQAIQK
jgi:hypothetical protein